MDDLHTSRGNDTMNATQRAKFEKFLLAERARLEETLTRVATPAGDAAGERGRPGDDLIFSSSGVSSDDDRAVVAHAARELEGIDHAINVLRTDPMHYGKCATCTRAIPLERLRLVPGTMFCQTHAHD